MTQAPTLNKLDEILALLNAMPKEHQEALAAEAMKATANMAWVPNPGPQTMAYECEADEVLYGGAAGGGKTQLLVGKALQKHKRSLLLRRLNVEVPYLVDLVEDLVGHRNGYNGQEKRWYLDERLIMFGGCQHPGDEKKYKGEDKDFIGVDEASEFLESQIEYVKMWLRTPDDSGVKCQLLLATNPPDGIKGQWVTRWFAPWVDPDHPLFPQPSGKILYFARKDDNEFEWSEEPFEVINQRTGKKTRALSRTFIRSTLDDNPDYAQGDYADRMAQGTAENRARYEGGEFVVEADDDEYQVIPSRWVKLAEQRWRDMNAVKPGPPQGIAMTAMGVDVAMGGADRFIIAPRYGEWFDKLILKPGKEIISNPMAAGHILSHVRDGAQVNIDMGGGYGSGVLDFLQGNDALSVYGFVPSGAASGKSACGKYKFRNVRAEAYWRLREALDPDGIYRIALPPDPELREELCAHKRRELGPGGLITIMEKSEIKQELQRSPDKADAVVIAWYTGNRRQRQFGANRVRQMASSSGLQTRTNQHLRAKRFDRYSRLQARAQRSSSYPGGGDGEQG
jgi:hypothetical protein